jgi:hypothetical protein
MVLCAWVLASGCVVVNSSSISEATGGGTAVSAETSDWGFMHLSSPTTLTADANTALRNGCQSGMMSGVTDQLKTREWIIIEYYTVTATANCK